MSRFETAAVELRWFYMLCTIGWCMLTYEWNMPWYDILEVESLLHNTGSTSFRLAACFIKEENINHNNENQWIFNVIRVDFEKINKPDTFHFILHSSLFITVFDGNSFPLVKCNKSPQTQTNHTLPSARCQEINTHSTHFSPHDCLHASESRRPQKLHTHAEEQGRSDSAPSPWRRLSTPTLYRTWQAPKLDFFWWTTT